MLTLALWCLSMAAISLGLPWWVKAAVCIPAVLWAPGLGFARWLGGGRAPSLQLALDAAWISVALSVPTVTLCRAAGGSPELLLHLSLAWGLLGSLLAWRAPRAPHSRKGAWVAFAAVVLALGAWMGANRVELSRPLDGFWYHPKADEEGHDPVPWSATDGWGEVELRGWEEAGAAALSDPEGDGGTLAIGGEGRVMFALRGPVGATLQVVQEGHESEVVRILADVIEVEEEGAVPRYLARGVVGLAFDAQVGPATVKVEGARGPTTLYVLPSTDAVWSLHADGALRFVHYYQLLNIVENLRWAHELLRDRWITVNQPPLWSYPLAVSLALVDPDLPGANALFVWVLLLLGLACVRLVELVAPDAPPPALAMPAVAAATVGLLMLEPGSTTFPDPLYAAALVAGLCALREPEVWRFVLVGLCAGLLRYPGVVALSIAALTHGLTLGVWPKRQLPALWGAVLALAAALAGVAAFTGELQEWLNILWFETGPEHYHGDTALASLLPRVPEFYATWLRYSGGALLAALPLAGRSTRFVALSALAYSLLLCTIDHFPTHYFLPLVALSAVAVASNAAALRNRALRWLLPTLALLGGLMFLAQRQV